MQDDGGNFVQLVNSVLLGRLSRATAALITRSPSAFFALKSLLEFTANE
jgi:hypothetical protein